MFLTRLAPRHQLAICLVAAILSAAGCSGDEGTTQDRAVDKVTYLTGAGAFGREAYAWVAQDKGFFRDQGIDVVVRAGSAGDNNLNALAAGQAQFVIADYAGAVIRAGQGNFKDYRIVAAVNQQTLISIMAVMGRGINAPKDLEGKTIGQITGAVPKDLFPSYASAARVDARQVSWVQTTPQQLPALLAAGEVDAIGQFVVGEPAIRKAAAGKEIVVLPYSQYLLDYYGNTVVTTKKLLADDPDLVRRFVAALMQGLRYAVENPDEAAAVMHRANPGTDAATAAEELKLMRDYVAVTDTRVPLGALHSGRVAKGIAAVQGQGLIASSVPPKSVVDFSVLGDARSLEGTR